MYADGFQSQAGETAPAFLVRTPVWKVTAMAALLLPFMMLWVSMIVLFAILAIGTSGNGAAALWVITFVLVAASRYAFLDLARVLIVAATYRVALSGGIVALNVPHDMTGPDSPGYSGRFALRDLVQIRSEIRIVHWMLGYYTKLTVWSGMLADGTRIELGTVRCWPGAAGEALHPQARSPVLRAAARLADAAGIAVDQAGLVTAPRGHEVRPATPTEADALARKAAGSARFASAMTSFAVAVMVCGMLLGQCGG